jgi:hypothetical protein
VKNTERFREDLSALPSPDSLKQREAAGWRPVAIEWEREVTVMPTQEASSQSDLSPSASTKPPEEIPYGLRITTDCMHLEENPAEILVLKFLAELIVQDASFTAMADALNQRGFRTRDGSAWTSVAVFKLVPRLIEAAPRILSGAEWANRKQQLSRIAWNS